MKTPISFICLMAITVLFFSNCKKNVAIEPTPTNNKLIPFENSEIRLDLTSEVCPSNLKRLYFLNQYEGICSTMDGNVFTTKDKGATWKMTDPSAFVTDLRLTPDRKTLIASGYQYGSNNSFIVISKDNGNTWSVVHTTPNSNTQSIAIGTDSVIYALSKRTTDTVFSILKSTNGGQKWDSISMFKHPYITPLTLVYASPSRLYMLVFGSFGLISTDGGKTFTEDKEIDFTSTYFVTFKNNIGYRIQPLLDNSQLLKTTNGGEQWTILFKSIGKYDKVTTVSPTTLFLFGESKRYKVNDLYGTVNAGFAYTLDAGATWKEAELPAYNGNNHLTLNSFYDEKHGFMIDDAKLYQITIK
jgi:photosystem II stability/assembly factor-like uncharacterized protein